MKRLAGSFGPHIEYSISEDMLHIVVDDYELMDFLSDLIDDIDDKQVSVTYDFGPETHGPYSIYVRGESGFERILTIVGSQKQEEIQRIFRLNSRTEPKMKTDDFVS